MFDEEMLLEGSFEAEHLIVAGGGSGGSSNVDAFFKRGGSGGAGDAIPGIAYLGPGAYPVVVGLGGASRPAGSVNGLNGGDSSAFGRTAKGGGGGGAVGADGLPGGSGGGGGGTFSGTTTGGAATGLGYPGSGGSISGGIYGAGGGMGGPASGTTAGPGIASAISGTSIIYSRGGDGSTAVDLNPGRGGFGGSSNDTGVSGAGLNGIVIIRYLGPQRATGGAVTTSGGYTIHTFTSNGTFTVL